MAVSALGCLAVAVVPRWPLVPLMPAVDSTGAVLSTAGMLGRITGGYASLRGGPRRWAAS
ncbi:MULTISPECIES: hypothetical protein [Streptomyces]|uniref:Uncharacterized protein n=1 Tax=Streptomyces flaveolus TaxID=67297 RepID=A0ABV3AK54_9ACTN|nr:MULTISPECIES: hypothetical protein [Streptomyces]